ncbi:MAG: RNA 2',3'-cyclic phosphodiesterase [Nitrospina sp.]|jgi:RNA 2',3'-cyclic 3'-phosphodiesterase|nr:RNA 2',3'-cyclic phosphodiesterase [Nitrospina sp.]
MSVVRAFIAVDLPPDLQERLAQVIHKLKEQMGDVPVRWVPAENMHLTLKFLGDVSMSNLDVLKDILRGEAVDREQMVISLGTLGAYPKVRRPRVIWVRMEAPAELDALQRSIDKQTARVGYARDNRPFSPHITMGRVSRNATPDEVRIVGDVLNTMKIGYLGVARIGAVHLYRSDLQSDGAVYSRIFSAPFEE